MIDAQASSQTRWLSESLDEGLRYSILSTQRLDLQHSHYQTIEVHSTPSFGNLLMIDGSFMASEKDEFFYHENLVHVPACAHPKPQTALIIGGGDGGSAEELLKHNTIQSVKLVEIDQAVLAVSRNYLRSINGGVMDENGGDPRLQIVVANGLQHMQDSTALYDLIILDLTDPGGPSQPLYTSEFYSCCAARLKPDGLLSLHVASPFAQADRVISTLELLCGAFKVVRPYLASIPLSGGQWMMVCASQSVDPAQLTPEAADRTIAQRGLTALQHYNGHTHQAAMALPNFVRQMVKPTGARII